MYWKSILRSKFVGVVLALALTVTIPVGYVAATEKDSDWGRGDDFANLIVDPIKTDAGYVSGTMIDVVERCWIYIPTFTPQCSPTLLGEVGKAVRVYKRIRMLGPARGGFALEAAPAGYSLEGNPGMHRVHPNGCATL